MFVVSSRLLQELTFTLKIKQLSLFALLAIFDELNPSAYLGCIREYTVKYICLQMNPPSHPFIDNYRRALSLTNIHTQCACYYASGWCTHSHTRTHIVCMLVDAVHTLLQQAITRIAALPCTLTFGKFFLLVVLLCLLPAKTSAVLQIFAEPLAMMTQLSGLLTIPAHTHTQTQ